MMKKELSKPPIVEALVEVGWKLRGSSPAGKYDPDYQFLLGTFFNSIKGEYPYHEPLPASAIPDDMSGRIIKHRFRVAEDDWPLIQIGPGIMTVNETNKYKTFDHFKPRAIQAMVNLYDSHPDKHNLEIESLTLRYIDAVNFDYSTDDIYDFLKKNMHLPIEFPEVLHKQEDIDLERQPVSFATETSFRSKSPSGVATFSVQTGHLRGKRAIIWNQILKSTNKDLPDMPNGFEDWITSSHRLIHSWFEGIIEGKLKEEFDDDNK